MANTELGAINSTPTGGVTPVENQTYQAYSYTFTATQSSEFLSFLFRNDPGFTWLDTVSLVANGDTTHTNVISNGGFDQGGQTSNPLVPLGWSTIGSPGLHEAGALGTAAASSDQVGKPQSGQYFWVDGAQSGYDGLGQAVTLVAGQSYTLSFQLAVDPNGTVVDTNGANAGIDTQIWVGASAQAAPPCFTRGTRILTDQGEVAVEHLAVGDLVVTGANADEGLQPIVWIGRSRFDARRHPQPEHVLPVRIRAGALGESLPRRDLVVSPGHALLLDGVLMQAARLVNGATIVVDRDMARGEYFHVELGRHDILISEGAPSESYLDTGNRSAFANGGAVAALHPDFSPRHWTETCVPLVVDGPRLAATRARLLARAEALGWQLAATPRPRLVVDGRDVAPLGCDGRVWRFPIALGAKRVRLRSAAASPAEVQATGDTRHLGLRVESVAVVANGVRRDVSLTDAALGEGWHGLESGPAGAWRWTDGDAALAVSGPCILELSVAGFMPTWLEVDTMPKRDRA